MEEGCLVVKRGTLMTCFVQPKKKAKKFKLSPMLVIATNKGVACIPLDSKGRSSEAPGNPHGIPEASLRWRDIIIVEKAIIKGEEFAMQLVTFDARLLYVVAKDRLEREQYLTVFRQYCWESGGDFGMSLKYHPAAHTKPWGCCKAKEVESPGCEAAFTYDVEHSKMNHAERVYLVQYRPSEDGLQILKNATVTDTTGLVKGVFRVRNGKELALFRIIDDLTLKLIAEWNMTQVRRYGCIPNCFHFEAGRAAETGEGKMYVRTTKAVEITAWLSRVDGRAPAKPPSPAVNSGGPPSSFAEPSQTFMTQRGNSRMQVQPPLPSGSRPPRSKSGVYSEVDERDGGQMRTNDEYSARGGSGARGAGGSRASYAELSEPADESLYDEITEGPVRPPQGQMRANNIYGETMGAFTSADSTYDTVDTSRMEGGAVMRANLEYGSPAASVVRSQSQSHDDVPPPLPARTINDDDVEGSMYMAMKLVSKAMLHGQAEDFYSTAESVSGSAAMHSNDDYDTLPQPKSSRGGSSQPVYDDVPGRADGCYDDVVSSYDQRRGSLPGHAPSAPREAFYTNTKANPIYGSDDPPIGARDNALVGSEYRSLEATRRLREQEEGVGNLSISGEPNKRTEYLEMWDDDEDPLAQNARKE